MEINRDYMKIMREGKKQLLHGNLPMRDEEQDKYIIRYDIGKIFVWCILAITCLGIWLGLVWLFTCTDDANAQELTPQMGVYGEINHIADSIYLAEGGSKTRHPYGILGKWHKSPRTICINTIKHQLKRWNGKGDFIVFLGKTYSPPNINPNWVRLVKYFMRKEK